MIMLYASLHELIHHFSAYLICGDWGYKTFNYFSTACEGERKSIYATYTGPLFNFIVMWVAAWNLKNSKSDYKKQIAFALIFAQLPLQRMITPFFQLNDEYYATVQLFGATPYVYWMVLLIIWIICVPPLNVAYQSIQNRRKLIWFLFYLTLFPLIIWGPIFGGLEYLLVSKKVMSETTIGIANLFILNEAITIIGFLLTKKYFGST
jgi:hypothetical protein